MVKYQTKQRKLIMDYFQRNTDIDISAKNIEVALKNQSISISAIYRNLSALESDGKIMRVTKHGTNEQYYRFTDCDKCRSKLHLSCTKCGKTFHMDTKSAENLISSVAESDGFSVDKTETVLFGVCRRCKG